MVLDQELIVKGLEHEAKFVSHVEHDLFTGRHEFEFASNLGAGRLVAKVTSTAADRRNVYAGASGGGSISRAGDVWSCAAETLSSSCESVRKYALFSDCRNMEISGGVMVEYEWCGDAPLSRVYKGSEFIPFR